MCFCHLLYPEDMALRDAYSHKIDAKFILKLYILKSVIRPLLPYTFIFRINRQSILSYIIYCKSVPCVANHTQNVF